MYDANPTDVALLNLQLEDCVLQLYKHNGAQYEYSSYLDLETTLAEQSEELEGFSDKYAYCKVYSLGFCVVFVFLWYYIFGYARHSRTVCVC